MHTHLHVYCVMIYPAVADMYIHVCSCVGRISSVCPWQNIRMNYHMCVYMYYAFGSNFN